MAGKELNAKLYEGIEKESNQLEDIIQEFSQRFESMTVSDSLDAVQLHSIDSSNKEENSNSNPPVHSVSLAEILNKTAEANSTTRDWFKQQIQLIEKQMSESAGKLKAEMKELQSLKTQKKQESEQLKQKIDKEFRASLLSLA